MLLKSTLSLIWCRLNFAIFLLIEIRDIKKYSVPYTVQIDLFYISITRDIGKSNLHHTRDRVLFNTPGLKINGHVQGTP